MDTPCTTPLRPHLVEHNLGAFRPRILLGAAVRVVAHLEFVNLQRCGVHATRRHRDHTRRRGGLESVQEQAGQEERPDDLARDRRLGAVRGHPTCRCQRTGIVDHDIESLVHGEDVVGEIANLVEFTHVGGPVRHPVVAGDRRECACRLGSALRVTPHQHEGGATAGQLLGRCSAQARCCSGHDDHATVQVVAVEWLPPAKSPAGFVAEAAEAGDHR